jgi:predicted dithiol-disulfide oxidoreductase (DUF899 family)
LSLLKQFLNMETNTMKPLPQARAQSCNTTGMAACPQTALQKEKELTHLYDRMRAERLKLPWIEVTKNYVFDGPEW